MILGGLQKMSLIDYPGKVAAVLFTRGCPLRCHYCHNPQLVLPESYASPISEDYVLEFLEERKGKLDGVVISGGEPLMHKDIARFLKQVKRMGYSIKLDTSGVFPEALQAVIDERLVDYIAMDVKAPFSRYGEVTGAQVDTEAVKRSLGIVRGSGIDYEFRTTIVKGQLSEAEILGIAEMLAGSKRYMLQKFRKCDTLDEMFRLRESYNEQELHRIRDRASRFVEICEVR